MRGQIFHVFNLGSIMPNFLCTSLTLYHNRFDTSFKLYDTFNHFLFKYDGQLHNSYNSISDLR